MCYLYCFSELKKVLPFLGPYHTVLPGAQSVLEIDALLEYYEKSEKEFDYSIIGTFAPPEASGNCGYCNSVTADACFRWIR